jgi:hypothetical protein
MLFSPRKELDEDLSVCTGSFELWAVPNVWDGFFVWMFTHGQDARVTLDETTE